MNIQDAPVSAEPVQALPQRVDRIASVPECWYHGGHDWLYYRSRCSPHITVGTSNAHVYLLMCVRTGEQIGFKICGFSRLPKSHRYGLLEYTGVDPEHIWGIELLIQLDACEKSSICTEREASSLEELCS